MIEQTNTIIALEGIKDSSQLIGVSSSEIKQYIAVALNKGASTANTLTKRVAKEQTRLQASRINKGLRVSKANRYNLTSVVTASSRPVTLTQFVLGTARLQRNLINGKVSKSKKTRNGLLVQVQNNASPTLFPKGFLLKGKSGNILFGVRLKPGERINDSIKAHTWKGITFLYGPSIDQLFKRIRDNVTPDTVETVEKEFMRLLSNKIQLNNAKE